MLYEICISERFNKNPVSKACFEGIQSFGQTIGP
jgi:hypothetical protein